MANKAKVELVKADSKSDNIVNHKGKLIKITLANGLNGMVRTINDGGKRGALMRINHFSQKEKDRAKDGVRQGSWGKPGFPQSERGLVPLFKAVGNNKSYTWSGSFADFYRLVGEIRFRYPHNYKDEKLQNLIIKIDERESELKDHLSNFLSPIFTNSIFRDTLVMKEGEFLLNTDYPLHEFYYLCMKDNISIATDTIKRSGATYLWQNLKTRNKKNVNRVKMDLEISDLFGIIVKSNDYEKLKVLGTILKLPSIDKIDGDALVNKFYDGIVTNTNPSKEADGISYREAFYKYAKMKPAELDVHYNIERLLSSRKIVKRANSYFYKTKKLPVSTKQELFDYLSDEKQTKLYIELTNA